MPGRVGPARRGWVGWNQFPKAAYLLAPGFQNGNDGGSNGTAISTANSGGASGDAWSTVTIGGTSTLTYSNTHAAHGTLSAAFQLAASTVTSLNTTKPGTTTQHWFEFYFWAAANPAATTTLYTALNGASVAATVALSTTGKLLLAPSSGTTVYTFTDSVTLNAWNRVEGFIVNSTGTGTMQARLYSGDSVTVVEDSGAQSTTSTLAQCTNHTFGQAAAAAGTTLQFWLDDCGVSTTGWLGPNLLANNPPVPARTTPVGPTVRGTFAAGTSATITCGSFTPTADSVLVAITWGDSVAGVASSATITDSLDGGWELVLLRNFATAGTNGYLQMWTRAVGLYPQPMAVTVTDSNGTRNHGGWVEEWTSVDTNRPTGAQEFRDGTSAQGDPQTVTLATATANSWVIGGMSNYDTSSFAAGASTTVTNQQSVSTFSGGCSARATTGAGAAGTSVSLTLSRAGTLSDWHLFAVELRGAPVITKLPTVRCTGLPAMSTASETTHVVPLPSQPAAWLPGDLCLIPATSRASGGGFGTTPTGWTPVVATFDALSSASSHMVCYGRILQAGDTDPTLTFTSGRMAAQSVAVRDHGLSGIGDLTGAVVAFTTGAGSAQAGIDAPSVTPPDASSLLLTFHGAGHPTTSAVYWVTAPPGESEVADLCTQVDGSTNSGVEVCSLSLTSAAATGTQTATATASVNGMGVAVAVKSQAAPPAPTWEPVVVSQYSGFF